MLRWICWPPLTRDISGVSQVKEKIRVALEDFVWFNKVQSRSHALICGGCHPMQHEQWLWGDNRGEADCGPSPLRLCAGYTCLFQEWMKHRRLFDRPASIGISTRVRQPYSHTAEHLLMCCAWVRGGVSLATWCAAFFKLCAPAFARLLIWHTPVLWDFRSFGKWNEVILGQRERLIHAYTAHKYRCLRLTLTHIW